MESRADVVRRAARARTGLRGEAWLSLGPSALGWGISGDRYVNKAKWPQLFVSQRARQGPRAEVAL